MKSKFKDINKITIITKELPYWKNFFRHLLIRLIRYFLSYLIPKYRYSGHAGVTRSLIEGFKKNGISYVYNPLFKKSLTRNVVVLANVKALKQIIEYKKKGILNKLIAGPNIVTFSNEDDHILSDKEINLVVTPSKWVSNIYIQDSPDLKEKCFEWPAGVDVNFWKPSENLKRDQVILYIKEKNSSINFKNYYDYLDRNGFKIKIIRYGSYTKRNFKKELEKSFIMICFSKSESQCIAWSEAWSLNVPILINENYFHKIKGRTIKVDNAPYLNEHNGLKFKDMNEFIKNFKYMHKNFKKYNTRNWLINNLSDEVNSKKLFDRIISI